MLTIPEMVIFDLDNTIYEYEPAKFAAEFSLVKYISNELKISADEVSSGLEEARRTVKLRLGPIASSHSRLLYIREFLTNSNIKSDNLFPLECEQAYWREYFVNMHLFPGVIQLMKILRERHIELILVTDLTTNIQLRKLGWLQLDKMFDLVITSEEAGGDKVSGKPEVLLKEKVLKIPNYIWCIGDSESDHLFKESSIFLRKVKSGKMLSITPKILEFSSFDDLIQIFSS